MDKQQFMAADHSFGSHALLHDHAHDKRSQIAGQKQLDGRPFNNSLAAAKIREVPLALDLIEEVLRISTLKAKGALRYFFCK